MKTTSVELGSYYRALTAREGVSPNALAAPWDAADIAGISQAFRLAFAECHFESDPLSVSLRTSSQSVGHRVAAFFCQRVNQHIRGFGILDCLGYGYPDKRLVRLRDDRTFVLELKSTSLFQPNNANRVVLTSDSRKLRRWFPSPVNHMLVLVAYDREDEQVWLRSGRLYFLEPDTHVNVRLEASLSHKLLKVASRTFVWAAEGGGV